ncbi:MAG: hypothetical protein R2710_27865 [Acidimicrobiales bacterium]
MAATAVILPDVSPSLIAALAAAEYLASGVGTVNVQLLRGLGRFKEGALTSTFVFRCPARRRSVAVLRRPA